MKIPDEAVEAAQKAFVADQRNQMAREPEYTDDEGYGIYDVDVDRSWLVALTAAAPAIVRANLEEIDGCMQRLLSSVADPPPQFSGMVRVRRRWLYELREALKELVNDD
jgi:hypothetical protein